MNSLFDGPFSIDLKRVFTDLHSALEPALRYLNLFRAKKQDSSLPGIDVAIKKAEKLVQSVNENVAVIEDATRVDWLVTHINHKNNFPNNLSSVEYFGIVIKRKSGRELVAFLAKNTSKQVWLWTWHSNLTFNGVC